MQAVNWARGWHAINVFQKDYRTPVSQICIVLFPTAPYQGRRILGSLISYLLENLTSHPSFGLSYQNMMVNRYNSDYLGSLHLCILVLLRKIMFYEKRIYFPGSVYLCPGLLRNWVNREDSKLDCASVRQCWNCGKGTRTYVSRFRAWCCPSSCSLSASLNRWHLLR